MAANVVHLVSSKNHNATPMKAMVVQGSDDYMAANAAGVAECAANRTVGTISAWINTDITGTYCIASYGDTNAQEYISLDIVAGKPRGVCYDGAAIKWSVISTTTAITTDGWHHVALIHDGTRPYLYLDGSAVTMTDTDATDLTVWSDHLDGLDNFSVGILSQNTSTTLDFVGGIAFVKLASVAWTAAEVGLEYAYNGGMGGTGNSQTRGVWASWDFEDWLDDATGGGTYTGTATGGAYLDSNYSSFIRKIISLYTGTTDIYNFTVGSSELLCLHVSNT